MSTAVNFFFRVVNIQEEGFLWEKIPWLEKTLEWVKIEEIYKGLKLGEDTLGDKFPLGGKISKAEKP